MPESEFDTIYDLYPGLDHRALQDKVWKEWLYDMKGEEASTVRKDFFKEDGVTPLFERHRVNKERGMNLVTLAEYTVGMIGKGFLKGLGSQIWAVPSDIHMSKFYLITAGTRFMAVYRAAAKEAESPSGPDGTMSPQLRATLAGGTGPVVLFNPRTPKVVLEWLRDIGNSLNDLSSSVTYIETFGLVPRVSQKWDDHRKATLPEKERSAAAIDKKHADRSAKLIVLFTWHSFRAIPHAPLLGACEQHA